MNNLTQLRLAKAAYSLSHPRCWPALRCGVAPSIEHQAVLAGLAPDLLIDVGANRGQFSLMFRLLHPGVPVQAYEPLPGEAAVFRRVHARRHGIQLHEIALGDACGAADLHVSARADSSSLLPIGDLQSSLFPHTAEVGLHRVEVMTLDSLAPHWGGASRALLKLDVQGFELNVLRGAVAALRQCAWVYVECSEVPLYAGQALRGAVESFLGSHGFRVLGCFNPSYADGNLVQADYLFVQS